MLPEHFDEILARASPYFKEGSSNSFPPDMRLEICIRYGNTNFKNLAHFLKYFYFSYLTTPFNIRHVAEDFLIGDSTAAEIITEVCTAIIKSMKDEVRLPSSPEEWVKVAAGFYEKTGVPNIIGALDGKHIKIKCPANSNSAFYSYKGYCSTVILVLCDADYNILYYSIGSRGAESDSGIFRSSDFYQAFISNQLHLPADVYIESINANMPFVFLGDSAFALNRHLLTPFPNKLLTQREMLFNFKHSSARMPIEQTFGLLATKFQLFQSTITGHIDRIDLATEASLLLHNFLRKKFFCNKRLIVPGIVQPLSHMDLSTNSGRNARWLFSEYLRGKFT